MSKPIAHLESGSDLFKALTDAVLALLDDATSGKTTSQLPMTRINHLRRQIDAAKRKLEGA